MKKVIKPATPRLLTLGKLSRDTKAVLDGILPESDNPLRFYL